MLRGDPTQPCTADELNGYHEWVEVQHAGTGDPRIGARECLKCGAFDYGPYDKRLNWKDAPTMIPPAATRSFRDLKTHNPEDPNIVHTPGESVN